MTLTGPDGGGAAPSRSSPEARCPPAPAGSLLSAAPSSDAASSDPVISDPPEVVVGSLPGAITGQGTLRPGGVRPLKDPVLPCRQPAEDFRFGCLRASEAEVGFHAGQRVRGEAAAFRPEQRRVGPASR